LNGRGNTMPQENCKFIYIVMKRITNHKNCTVLFYMITNHNNFIRQMLMLDILIRSRILKFEDIPKSPFQVNRQYAIMKRKFKQ
jgi:hypothetical protein